MSSLVTTASAAKNMFYDLQARLLRNADALGFTAQQIEDIKETKFNFDGAKKRLGVCKRSGGAIRIYVSEHMLLNGVTEEILLNTLTHEFAHVLTPRHGHDKVWREMHIRLGGDGKRCSEEDVLPKAPWMVTCVAHPNTVGHCRAERWRVDKKLMKKICRRCKSPLKKIANPNRGGPASAIRKDPPPTDIVGIPEIEINNDEAILEILNPGFEVEVMPNSDPVSEGTEVIQISDSESNDIELHYISTDDDPGDYEPLSKRVKRDGKSCFN